MVVSQEDLKPHQSNQPAIPLQEAIHQKANLMITRTITITPGCFINGSRAGHSYLALASDGNFSYFAAQTQCALDHDTADLETLAAAVEMLVSDTSTVAADKVFFLIRPSTLQAIEASTEHPPASAVFQRIKQGLATLRTTRHLPTDLCAIGEDDLEYRIAQNIATTALNPECPHTDVSDLPLNFPWGFRDIPCRYDWSFQLVPTWPGFTQVVRQDSSQIERTYKKEDVEVIAGPTAVKLTGGADLPRSAPRQNT